MEHAKHRKSVRGKDYEVDLEIGSLGGVKDLAGVSELGDRRLGTKLPSKVCNGHFDEVTIKCLSLRGNISNHEEIMEIVSADGLEEEWMGGNSGDQSSFKDKKKKMNHKKPSKPPRPPKGPSINASDHKLIQKISECASLKHARMERIRALKKARAASTSSSLSSNVVAMLFTIIFFVVIIFQGMSPRENSTSSGIEQTSGLEGRMHRGFISNERYADPHVPVHNELASKTANHDTGSDVHENKRRTSRLRRMLD